MKLLRTIRFDGSDDYVFEQSAGPDEWAISGGFAFADLDPEAVTGKTKQAFANGFWSIESHGRSTFTTVAELDDAEHDRLVHVLATHFCEACGAPGMDEALGVARAEIGFIAELVADAPINTVFTVRRVHDDTGAIREEYRTVTPPSEPVHTRIWDVADDADH